MRVQEYCRYFQMASIVVSVLAVGCSPSYEEPAPKVEGEFLVHVVHDSGETVKQLAKWYTGSEENVAALRRANKGISSGELKNGRKVFIPLALVVNTEPLLLVLPTPTPSKLIVIPEQTRSVEESDGSVPQDVSNLDRFEEEVGPAEAAKVTEDRDVMVLKGAPTVPSVVAPQGAPASGAIARQQPLPSQPSPSQPSPSQPSPSRPMPAPLPQGGAKTVEDFESQVDKLLLNEQAELDQLQRELAAGGATQATPARSSTPANRR